MVIESIFQAGTGSPSAAQIVNRVAAESGISTRDAAGAARIMGLTSLAEAMEKLEAEGEDRPEVAG